MRLVKSLSIAVLSLIITIILVFISFYFKLPSIINVIIIDIFIIFIFTYIVFLTFNNSKSMQKKYSKNESLYYWIEELPDYDNYLMNIIKGRKAKYKTIDNLKVLKRLVMSLTKRNKETLKLYKAFYTHRSKETADEMYWKTILVILPTIGIFFIRDYLPKVDNGNGNILFLIATFLFISIAAITHKLNHNKKRTGLLIEIIEICIEEVEEKIKA